MNGRAVDPDRFGWSDGLGLSSRGAGDDKGYGALIAGWRRLALDDKWITLKPNGPEHVGSHVKLDDRGDVVAGLGGKFKDQHISQVRGKVGRATSRSSAYAAFKPFLGHKEEAEHARIHDVAKQAATDFGFDPNRVHMSKHTYPFKVDGKDYTAGGIAVTAGEFIHHAEDYKAGDVVLFGRSMYGASDRAMRQLMTHEIQHHRYRAVMDRYRDERDACSQNDDMNPDGSIKTGMESKYPTYAAVFNALEGYTPATRTQKTQQHYRQLQESDGVTSYSKAYWDANAHGKGLADTAIDETLAEIASRYEVALQEHRAMTPEHRERNIVNKTDLLATLQRDLADDPSPAVAKAIRADIADVKQEIAKLKAKTPTPTNALTGEPINKRWLDLYKAMANAYAGLSKAK